MKIPWLKTLRQSPVERYRDLWLRAARGEFLPGLDQRTIPRTSTEPSELDALVGIVSDAKTPQAEREAARQGLLLACESVMWPTAETDSPITKEQFQKLVLAAEQVLRPLYFERDPDPSAVTKLRSWLLVYSLEEGVDPDIVVDIARLAATVELRVPSDHWKALYRRLDSAHQDCACRSVFAGIALTSLDEALYWLASIGGPPFQMLVLDDMLPWLLDRKIVTPEGACRSLQRMMVYYPREVAGQIKASIRSVIGDVPDSNERDETLNSLRTAVLLWLNRAADDRGEFQQFLTDLNTHQRAVALVPETLDGLILREAQQLESERSELRFLALCGDYPGQRTFEFAISSVERALQRDPVPGDLVHAALGALHSHVAYYEKLSKPLADRLTEVFVRLAGFPALWPGVQIKHVWLAPDHAQLNTMIGQRYDVETAVAALSAAPLDEAVACLDRFLRSGELEKYAQLLNLLSKRTHQGPGRGRLQAHRQLNAMRNVASLRAEIQRDAQPTTELD